MTPVDLEPAARRLAELIGGVPDELLDAPTPCPEYTLGDLVEHVGGAAAPLTRAAAQDLGGAPAQGPPGDSPRRSGDLGHRNPRAPAALAAAGREPGARAGRAQTRGG